MSFKHQFIFFVCINYFFCSCVLPDLVACFASLLTMEAAAVLKSLFYVAAGKALTSAGILRYSDGQVTVDDRHLQVSLGERCRSDKDLDRKDGASATWVCFS